MKKLVVAMSLIFSIIGNNALAITEAEQQVIVLEKDFPAPFRGYLFPEDKALKFRKDLLQLDTLKSLNESYERSITLYKNNEELFNYKINTLMDQNDRLAKAAYQAQDRDKFENWFWFGMGFLLASAGVYLGSKVTK